MNTRTRNWLIGGIVGFVVVCTVFEPIADKVSLPYVFAVVLAYVFTKPKDEEGVAA